MIIEYAEQNDIPSLAKLAQKWASGMGYKVECDAIEKDLARIWQDGIIAFVQENDEIIGMMNGVMTYHFWIDEWIAHEHWFFVRPDYQGKGIGKLLERAFEMWAKVRKCKSIILSPNRFGTMDPEKAAEGFKKYGYHLHGVLMRKEIQENVHF